MKVVLDTNVIISAFLWAGSTSRILDLVENKKITVFTCEEQITELKGVLARPKFKTILKKANLMPETLVSGFLNSSFLAKELTTVNVIEDDPADNRILACALSAGAKYLISGDKHLLALGRFPGVKIITVKEFLKEVG